MLWIEQYRPKTLDAFVWRDPAMRRKAEEWLAEGVLPHLLFAGVPGTGKTSLAKLLFRQLGVNAGDILEIRASSERNVDVIQERVGNFAGTWPIGRMKYVLLDEADGLSFMAQRLLRGEIEHFHEVCRFVITCNDLHKMSPAIRSRCQEFTFSTLTEDDYIVRLGEVLATEQVRFDDDTLFAYVRLAYPDLRKAINLVQQNTLDGELRAPRTDDEGTKDYLLETIALFRNGQYRAGRQLLVSRAQAEEYPDIFRYLYSHLDLFGDDPERQDDALLIIRDAVVNHNRCADPEINLSACLCELMRVSEAPR